MKAANDTYIQPKVGQGIYTAKDVAHILKLPSHKVSRCMREFLGKLYLWNKGQQVC